MSVLIYRWFNKISIDYSNLYVYIYICIYGDLKLRYTRWYCNRDRDFEVAHATRKVCLFRITLPSTVHEFPFYTPVNPGAIIRDSPGDRAVLNCTRVFRNSPRH